MSASGAVIMSVFAAVWWITGGTAAGYGSVRMDAIPVAVTVGVIVLARRWQAEDFSSAAERARRGRLVGIASGIEGLAIFLAINVLANVGKRDFAVPVIAIIVGLHFFPQARWLPARLYYLTGTFLVALGLAGLRLSDTAVRLLTVSIGAACVLWLTSVAVLLASATRKSSLRPMPR